MCMVDNGDGVVTLLSKASPIARLEHKCHECHRKIIPGERYFLDRYVWEDEFHNHKVCAHCEVVRTWLRDECGGWLYNDVEEDLREHAQSGAYPLPVIRLAVGMAWKWRAPSGRLLPVPGVPLTTGELLKLKRDARETA